MEESELRRALRETKETLRQVGDELRGMVNAVRPEEPLTKKTRKILTSPIRRRLRRRLESYRRKREEE
jgi:hypothetical protein